jgi:hypothetical protein
MSRAKATTGPRTTTDTGTGPKPKARSFTRAQLAAQALARAEVDLVVGRGGADPFDDPEYDQDDLPEGWEEPEPDADMAEDDRDEPVLGDDGRWRLELVTRLSGAVSLRLPSRSGAPSTDVRRWEDRMEQIGGILVTDQLGALVARDGASALQALRPMTQESLATRLQRRGGTAAASELSRARRTLVACRWGVVPLEFFWWTGRNRVPLERRVEASQTLLDLLHMDPTLTPNALKGLVGAGDWVRKEVSTAQLLLERWPFVLRLRHTPESWSQDTLDRLIGRPADRGEMLVRLAVTGLINVRHGGDPR